MKTIISIAFTAYALFSPLQGENLNWSSNPEILSGNFVNTSEPQIAMDANGNTIALWIENNQVKARTKLINQSWTIAANLSTSNSSAARLVLDNNGNAFAIWIENEIIKASIKPVNQDWTNSVVLSNTGASFPSLCVDDAGNVTIAWARNGNIEIKTKMFNKINWQATITIQGTGATTPIVKVGGSGNNKRAVVVWQGITNGSNAIFTASKSLTGNWSSPQTISILEHNAANPNLAVDANGNSLAIWYAYDIVGLNYSNVSLQAATHRIDSNLWESPKTLSQAGVRNPSTLKAVVAFDTIGNAIALWNTSYDDETFSLESAVKSLAGQWSETIDLVDANVYAFSADLSTTSFGDVLGLYMFYNGASLMIQSIESNINGYLNNFWSVPVTISIGSNNAYPKIAATLIGNELYAAAIWANYNGANNTVMASIGSKTLVSPPSNLSISENLHNFGVFKEYYTRLTWDESTDPTVVGYLIFRNGVFLAQVGTDTQEFIDNNRILNNSVTYSMAAIDDEHTQSRMVSFSFP